MIAGSEVAAMMENLRPLTQEQRQVCDARTFTATINVWRDRENAFGSSF
jgi:hypothetical protein